VKPIRHPAPATSILSPRFKYTPAAATDIRETFTRARLDLLEINGHGERLIRGDVREGETEPPPERGLWGAA